jgi:lauroyl/myristoyl acyltransferase
MLVTLIAQFVAFFVPQKVAEFIAVILADAFRIFDWRTKAVMRNLEIFFPDKPLRERKLIMRDTFRKMFLSYVRVMKLNRKKWENYMELKDLEVFKGKKSIVFSIHMGPWDIASKYINLYGFEFYALMENLPKFYLWMWLRFRKGIKVFLVGTGTIKALQRLKRGKEYALVVLIDRVTSGKYVVRKFQGQDVIFAEGIFKLPKILESDVYFLTCHWDEEMRKVRFDIVPLERENIEKQIFELFAESVRKYPDQWFNFYFFTTQRPI